MPVKEPIDAVKGFLYMLRAPKILLSDWRLFRLSLAPLLVNVVLFSFFFLAFNWLAYEVSTRVFEESTQAWYWAALSMILGLALFAVSIIVVMFGFVIVGLIIAAPFNDMLAAAVEEKLTGRALEAPMSLWGLIKLTVKNEAKKAAVILSVQLALILINILPGIGQVVFVVASPVFMALVLAFEFTSYTLDRRGFSFGEKRGYIFSIPGLSIGFGLAVGLTLVIPALNFLLLPLSVAGGTMLVVENPPRARS